MLFLGQDIVSDGFFNFFFLEPALPEAESSKLVSLETLKVGVAKFRTFALLFFGNFRFAYKGLIRLNYKEITDRFKSYLRDPAEVELDFKKRPDKMLDIDKIPRDKTWFLGYVSGKKVEREYAVIRKSRKKEYASFKKYLANLSCQIEGAQTIALRNTGSYLTWDCMDLYFATSMRNKWEYEETYDFIDELFNDLEIQKFKLRYFDPTQSTCGNSREKGLIEGLMLKRSICTIYLAQETDTMGKDSELAATLAQNKPVIAYVPSINPDVYAEKIETYPLFYFKKRLFVLLAEETFEEIPTFDDQKYFEALKACDINFKKTIYSFIQALENHRRNQAFELWEEKELDFKKNCKIFKQICKIISIGEWYNFDRRADLLRLRHPLSMQVDLQSGIANGVLVVRNADECRKLIRGILTNELKFTIVNDPKGFVLLQEEISKSPFRVILNNEQVTNSYWNLFFSH